jgi:hypothetical protein
MVIWFLFREMALPWKKATVFFFGALSEPVIGYISS